MHIINSHTWTTRTVTLALIAATITLVALMASSSPSAQGQAIDSPATISECKEEQSAGRAVACSRNSFAVTTVRPDGSYHIDWSAWADRYSDVERYTVQRLRFMYRYNFELEADGTSVEVSDYTAPDVNSCWPWAVERNNGQVTRFAWGCSGISNVLEDPSGQPTSIEQLAGYGDNSTAESQSDSLLAPGRKHDIPVRALRIPGSRDTAHPDNPQSYSDRLTQQQVDDGTQDLLASDVEMHLYYITAHFEDGTTRRGSALVNGGPFNDR